MSLMQMALATWGITALGALGAGAIGVVASILISRLPGRSRREGLRGREARGYRMPAPRLLSSPALKGALMSYGGLTVLMSVLALLQPLRASLNPFAWQLDFPQVSTRAGFVTAAGPGQVFRFFLHPGTSIAVVAFLSYLLYRYMGHCDAGSWRGALRATWRSAAPSSVGIIAMVGLAALMDHCGMTILLAQGLSAVVGAAFPLVSPAVGMLGAFATGSNNNSNVLFASLQKSAALLLALDPRILLAAQTTGGSLGSMIAPAKMIVGCSTVGLDRRDGEVLRRTLPYGILIGLVTGIFALVWSVVTR
jgi:lactate permease